MNRRTFLRGAAAVPLAAAAALLPREPQRLPFRSTVDGKEAIIGIHIDLQQVMPQDGKWHDISINTRALASPPPASPAAYVDHLSIVGSAEPQIPEA